MSFSLSVGVDDITWDSFVRESPHGAVFCRADFIKSLEEDYELLLVMENGRATVGAIVLMRDGGPLTSPFPMTMYHGVLCNKEFSMMPNHRRSKWLIEHLTFLLTAMGDRYPRISFCLFHQFDDLRPFQWFHYAEPHKGMFKIDLRYTALLDLTGIPNYDAYLTHVRPVRRQEYRKALAEGFTVESSHDICLLNNLHGKTFERQGLVRSNDEERLLLSISRTALEKGYGELLVCRDRFGAAAAATLFLEDTRYAYYLFGANDPVHRKSGAGTLLLMENIRRCLGKGLAGVDFVGINSPNRGDFKTSLGAKPMSYFLVNYTKPTN